MSFFQGSLKLATGIDVLFPIILVFTAPTLLLRAFMMHGWGVWAAAVAGAAVAVPYYFWLAGGFRPPTYGSGQQGGWDILAFVFAGTAAGAAWWWVEWKLR